MIFPPYFMKKRATYFLQMMIALIGIAVLVFLLWEPHLEGRNVQASFFQVYFHDGFLLYAYAASTAFFMALYQIFKILGYARQNRAFSRATEHAVRMIRKCALAMMVFVLVPEAYLLIVRPGDDIAGGVFLGMLVGCASMVLLASAITFEGILEEAKQREGKRCQ